MRTPLQAEVAARPRTGAPAPGGLFLGSLAHRRPHILTAHLERSQEGRCSGKDMEGNLKLDL